MGIPKRRAVAAGAEPAVVAAVLLFYFANQLLHLRRPAPAGVAATEKPHRGAGGGNEIANSGELLDQLLLASVRTPRPSTSWWCRQSDQTGWRPRTVSLDLAEATQQAAQQRLDYTLTTLRSDNLDADGALGDYRPLQALAGAVDSPTRIRS